MKNAERQAWTIAVTLFISLFFLWGGLDQLHFALGSDESNLPSLLRASQMNPYDAMLQARIASASTKAGQKDEALAALMRAVAINPGNAGLQHAAARAMIEDGRYTEAAEAVLRSGEALRLEA